MQQLRFHPHMTLTAAARIADQHGCELVVKWNGKQPVVTTMAKPNADEHIPFFLRQQAS